MRSMIAVLLAVNCNNEQNKMQLEYKMFPIPSNPCSVSAFNAYFPNPNTSM